MNDEYYDEVNLKITKSPGLASDVSVLKASPTLVSPSKLSGGNEGRSQTSIQNVDPKLVSKFEN